MTGRLLREAPSGMEDIAVSQVNSQTENLYSPVNRLPLHWPLLPYKYNNLVFGLLKPFGNRRLLHLTFLIN